MNDAEIDKDLTQLCDTRVIVVGAGSGLGSRIARVLMEHGAKVVMADNARDACRLNRNISLDPCDNSGSMQPEELQRLRDDLVMLNSRNVDGLLLDVPLVRPRLAIEPVLLEDFARPETTPPHGWYQQFAGKRGRPPRY